jgi:hypothetical protein
MRHAEPQSYIETLNLKGFLQWTSSKPEKLVLNVPRLTMASARHAEYTLFSTKVASCASILAGYCPLPSQLRKVWLSLSCVCDVLRSLFDAVNHPYPQAS